MISSTSSTLACSFRSLHWARAIMPLGSSAPWTTLGPPCSRGVAKAAAAAPPVTSAPAPLALGGGAAECCCSFA
eukprot:scaffold69223_cov60-Phaeocystis_antarctica.AAC.6